MKNRVNSLNGRAEIRPPVRWVVTAVLFCLCGLLAGAVPAPQEKDDETRRLWNMHFLAARAKAKRPQPKSSTATDKAVKVQSPGPTSQAVAQPGATPKVDKPNEPSAKALTDTLDDELIGLTIWRSIPTSTSGNPDATRKLVQEAKRVKADTRFKEGELVWLGIELPREGNSYLYVIDREEYTDGTTSEPYLIFPGATMPTGGNVMAPGKLAYVPAQGDPIPYFTLRPSRKDQVSEKLTIIVSPEPLRFSITEETLASGAKLFRLETTEIARLEREWGGPTEHREEKGGEGKVWTAAEKEAGEGNRVLTQEDPLPQTIYHVRVKPGAPVVVHVPLRIVQ